LNINEIIELLGNHESDIENLKLRGVKVKHFKNSKVKDIVIPVSSYTKSQTRLYYSQFLSLPLSLSTSPN
jgi:hypothetical protein